MIQALSSKMYRLAVAVVVSLSLMPTRASALPFKTDKQSFNRYLNQLTWKDGKRREFRDLGGCQKGGAGLLITAAHRVMSKSHLQWERSCVKYVGASTGMATTLIGLLGYSMEVL